MTPLVVIPARMESTRFPGKPLCELGSRPLLAHAVAAAGVWPTVVATEDAEISAWCNAAGTWCIDTGPARNGTERAAIINRQLGFPVVVNLQCDEPDLTEADLRLLVAGLARAPVATLACPISEEERAWYDCVKVTVDSRGMAGDFFRQPGPGLAHVGAYAFCQEALISYGNWPVSQREQWESLEQLRFVEHRLPVSVGVLNRPVISINRPEDVKRWQIARIAAQRAAS